MLQYFTLFNGHTTLRDRFPYCFPSPVTQVEDLRLKLRSDMASIRQQ